MSRRYEKPPIAQAICEFQFGSDKVWDWTIPGLIYPKISEQFPEKRQEQAFEITVTPQDQNPVQRSSGLSKMQFVARDQATMVQVGPDLLAINAQSKYPGWPTFFKLITEQFNIYTEIASPNFFRRIGLRYINQIHFDVDAVEMTKYFRYYLHLPENIEQTHGPFHFRVVHNYEDKRDALTINFGNVVPSRKLSYLLDLDYSLIHHAKVKLGDGLKWVEAAHARIEDMFEACITDELRAVFQEQK